MQHERYPVAALCAVTAAIAVTTFWGRVAGLQVRDLAASPAAVAQGRVWLLFSSVLIADRPAAASLIGFMVVGLATLAVCGARALLVAGVAGHVLSAIVVYLAIALIRVFAPAALRQVVTLADYGTSAVIAAWIGAVAHRWWSAHKHVGRRFGVLALCAAAGLIGWLLSPDLTVLDSEHAVALGIGVATAWTVARFAESPSWPSLRYSFGRARVDRRPVPLSQPGTPG
jgi:hypothetical protein